MKKQLEEALTLTVSMLEQAKGDNWELFEQLSAQRALLLDRVQLQPENTNALASNSEREALGNLIREMQQVNAKIAQLTLTQREGARAQLGKISRANQAIAAYRQI